MISENQNKIEVDLQWEAGLQIKSFIRNFNPILMDDKNKGEDSAPTPVELFLASIGSCLAMSFIYCLYVGGFSLEPADLQVRMQGDIERRKGRLRVVGIQANFIIKAEKKLKKIEKCFEKFQPFCILSESVKSGIPLTCELKVST